VSDAAKKAREVLSEAEYLELAALTAPVLRREDEAAMKAKRRRVYVVKRDDENWSADRSKPAEGADVLRGLAKIQELEHVVEDGRRPKTVVCCCRHCKRAILVRKMGGKPPSICYGGCIDCQCGTSVSRESAQSARRNLRRASCDSCTRATRRLAAKKWQAAKTSEQRSESVRLGHSRQTANQRSYVAKARDMRLTPERRAERAKKASEAAAEIAREAARARTKCKNGHEWTMQNKRPVKSGTGFRCRVCHREDMQRRARRARAATPSPAPKETHE